MPRFGASGKSELDVEYRPATDANGKPYGDRFPADGNARDVVRARFTVARDGDDIVGAMAEWADRCPQRGVYQSTGDNGIRTWLVAESTEKLVRYQSGDVAGQWPFVVNMAAAVLPGGVIVQVWYQTSDPSAASRKQLLTQLVGAAGRPRPRSALPASVADWNRAQISTLLPTLSVDTSVQTGSRDDSDPGGRSWYLCPSSDRGLTPRYNPLATWQDFNPSKWDESGKPPRPKVTISRAPGGDDVLADLRRELATCTAQWMREVDVRGHSECGEGVEALRVTQVRGLVVISSSSDGGWLFKGDTPPLPLSTLDGLLAETVRNIKAA